MGYRYTVDALLQLIERQAPDRTRKLLDTHRHVPYGLLSVGLKLHCLDGGSQFKDIVVALREIDKQFTQNTFKRNQKGTFCWVLPPVGNVDSAITLLEAIEEASCSRIFNNPQVQIQVCTPGRLTENGAALLSIGFCIGSDYVRRFYSSDLDTTYRLENNHLHAKRLTIYDARGDFDPNYEWWDESCGSLYIRPTLPFDKERTDLLPAMTRTDLRNINLLASLFIHEERGGYWSSLGRTMKNEMHALLLRYDLHGVLNVPWIRQFVSQPTNSAGPDLIDSGYGYALHELMDKALAESDKLKANPLIALLRRQNKNLLTDMSGLLRYCNAEVRRSPRSRAKKTLSLPFNQKEV